MSSSNFKAIKLSDIQEAQKNIAGSVVRTPLQKAPGALKQFVGDTEVFFKMENEQLAGSFKIRGALNKMGSLTEEQKKLGVVASSAGNHAQGVALGAKKFGAKAHIVMPVTAPIVKVDATKGYGAEVILHGDFYDEAYAHAKLLEKEKGYIFVHPFEDPKIIAGQGTIGLEIYEDFKDLDSVVVPIGGGGLISGIATALKALNPKIKVYGVVSSQASGLRQMYKGVKPDAHPRRIATIADGIAVKNPSALMFETYIKPLIDDIVEVDDDELSQAIVFLLEKAKTVVEGSGAAALAAAMLGKLELGKKSVVILSGGNIDLNIISKVIETGLRRAHRLARISVVVDDVPGNLHRITGIMTEKRANILEVYHDRVSPDLGLRETRIDVLVETTSDEQINEIHNALKAIGYKILSS